MKKKNVRIILTERNKFKKKNRKKAMYKMLLFTLHFWLDLTTITLSVDLCHLDSFS